MSKVAAIGVTAEERHARVQLAALYRAFVHYGWTDLLDTHISARVPGAAGEYLINPYDLLFEEITASSLLKVDFSGRVLAGDGPLNVAGQLIHSTVLKARPEINFVLHSHTRTGIAVSAMACGLLPATQHACGLLGTLAYHDYRDVTAVPDEGPSLVRDLGGNYLMILRNHGLLACGRTAAEAFLYHYFLDVACKMQVDMMGAGTELVVPPASAVSSIKEWGAPRAEGPHRGEREWKAIMRKLDREQPDYRN
jgi:ribulose-5-phosphate 4-epimerase/fuculose-1-phosphate aldolase